MGVSMEGDESNGLAMDSTAGRPAVGGSGGNGFEGGSFKGMFWRFCWNAMIRAWMSPLNWPWEIEIGGRWEPSKVMGLGERFKRSNREAASARSLSSGMGVVGKE